LKTKERPRYTETRSFDEAPPLQLKKFEA